MEEFASCLSRKLVKAEMRVGPQAGTDAGKGDAWLQMRDEHGEHVGDVKVHANMV